MQKHNYAEKGAGPPKDSRASNETIAVIDILRKNEAALMNAKPRKPGSSSASTGWGATRGKLLSDVCNKVTGHIRSLSLGGARWSGLLAKVAMAANDEDFARLSSEILGSHILELAVHPHGSQVVHACVYQVAQHRGLEGGVHKRVSEVLESACKALAEGGNGGWESLMKDQMGAGVSRALLMVCGGFKAPAWSEQACTIQWAEAAGSPPTMLPAPSFWALTQATLRVVATRPALTCTDWCASTVVKLLLESLAARARSGTGDAQGKKAVDSVAVRAAQDAVSLSDAIFSHVSDPSGRRTAEVVTQLIGCSEGCEVVSAAAGASMESDGNLVRVLAGFAVPRASWLCGVSAGDRAAPTSSCSVSYVLLVSGSSDHKGFKPAKDESQWWGRRDALCRSVAAALWDGEGRPYAHVSKCSLLFDDRGCMSMQREFVKGIRVPTEGNLIKAWRDAALGTHVPGLRRKAAPNRACGCEEEFCACNVKKSVEFCLKGHDPKRTTVVLLHEDYPNELPVFGAQSDEGMPGGDVVFLMGTVRDVSAAEEIALVEACKMKGFIVVGANLGRTAEFTSKIVHAINMHAMNLRIGPAVAALAQMTGDESMAKIEPQHRSGVGKRKRQMHSKFAGADGERKRRKKTDSHREETEARKLHFVVCVSGNAKDVSSSRSKREDVYTLSQVCVCALWRSNLAEIKSKGLGEGVGAEHECVLSLVFECGTVVTADERLVLGLASDHKAAPSEKQIMCILEEAISGQLDDQRFSEGVVVRKSARPSKALRHLLKKHSRVFVVSGVWGAAESLAAAAYGGECVCCSRGGGDAKPLRADGTFVLALGCDARLQTVVQKGVSKCCCSVSLVHVTPPGAPSSPQAAISLIQHWAYHQRLEPALASVGVCAGSLPWGVEDQLVSQGDAPKCGRDLIVSLVGVCRAMGMEGDVKMLEGALAKPPGGAR